MNADKLKELIGDGVSIVCFWYHGKDGNIDHCYDAEAKRHDILLYFDGEEITVHSAEDAMNTPFVGGKTLAEIAEDLEIE